MATKLEEDYLSSWIRPTDSVFEFGPGNCVWAGKLSNKFVGVDLYSPESTPPSNMKYIEGNLLDINLDQKFDIVACLSSFEHAGIEQPHFRDKCVDIEEHIRIVQKFISLVKDEGLISLTLPGGKVDTYYVDINGRSYTAKEQRNSDPLNIIWGYRTFTLNRIKTVFGWSPIDHKAYLRKPDSDYFDTDSWEEVDSSLLENTIYHEQNGLLCVTFKKNVQLG